MIPDPVKMLFSSRGWSPFAFQERAWEAYLAGKSGLINAPTGVGKTWAAWLGPVIEALGEPSRAPPLGKTRARASCEPLRVVWLTPLRALANDTALSILEPVQELGLPWTVEVRTGDTAQSVKRRQKERLPTALVTTPESLTLLLSYPDAAEQFGALRCVVVDEWHELMGSKRGVQTELALARLRTLAPSMRTWGVSATLGNLGQARDVLLGSRAGASESVMVRGEMPKALDIRTIIPPDIERFPWAGHLGLRSVEQVIEAILAANSTLLFTNTRSQAELWFGRLLTEALELVGVVAIHHGSMSRALRANVEALLAAGKLKCVVCTSSLDLGVDFAPVDQVIQVGSPKGVARLVQRAGRSGHQPGALSRVLCVPTHAFELVEFAAVRDAAALGQIESRLPLERSLDVLAQHVVTIACASPFVEEDLFSEVRSTHAFRNVTDLEWSWVMDFVRRGGPALGAYPHFARIRATEDGRWTVADLRTARTHRMSIGTITSESAMSVKYLSGRVIGHIEEEFIARLHVGAKFVLAGRVLEILRVRDMTVFVERARNKSAIVPRWNGGRFSLSTQLSAAVRQKLEEARQGRFIGPEMQAAESLLELQRNWSVIPSPEELLIEAVRVDKVFCVFLNPFEGRQVHEGIGTLLAYRLSRRSPITVTATATDYGIGLRSGDPIVLSEADWRNLLSPESLLEDLGACMNSSNLARRQFRDIARIAGLIVPGFPGSPKPTRQVQASSQMFFDVFEQFDPENLLLEQARREVLEGQLEIVRLRAAIERMRQQRLICVSLPRLSPLSFPVWAENLRASTLSSEKWGDMVRKMLVRLEEESSREDETKASVRRKNRGGGGVSMGR